MTSISVTFTLPLVVYERLKEVAAAADLTIEEAEVRCITNMLMTPNSSQLPWLPSENFIKQYSVQGSQDSPTSSKV